MFIEPNLFFLFAIFAYDFTCAEGWIVLGDMSTVRLSERQQIKILTGAPPPQNFAEDQAYAHNSTKNTKRKRGRVPKVSKMNSEKGMGKMKVENMKDRGEMEKGKMEMESKRIRKE